MTVIDVKPGLIKACQICDSKKIYEILDLGYSGLCDSLLTKKDLNKSEKSYPLKLLRCKNCHLLQLNYVVDNNGTIDQLKSLVQGHLVSTSRLHAEAPSGN